jgi:hypothetical protein
MPPELVPLNEPIYTLVDDEDFDWFNQRKWFLAAGSPYVDGYVDGSYIKMHRTIMQHAEPLDDPDSWDMRYKDKNKLHNYRSNLERIPCRQPKHHRGQWL